MKRKTGFLILLFTVGFSLPLFAQEGKEMSSGGTTQGPSRYLVYMHVSEERGMLHVKSYVIENADTGTYSFARNSYDGKKSRLEIVDSGTFVIEDNSIVLTSSKGGAPLRGKKSERFIHIDGVAYIIAEEPKVIVSSPPEMP